MPVTRRSLILGSVAASGALITSRSGFAQSFGFTPNQRYPDPALEILDPAFLKYRIYSSTLEQVATGMRWAEGPVYFPDGGYVLCSDAPNNRIMKYSERDGSFTVFRQPANYANGNARDLQGRLITCEHSVTRRIVRTEANGKLTVLADLFERKRLNAPNDLAVGSDGSIWFTDPTAGINGNWEGEKARQEQATTNVYRLGPDGRLTAVLTDLSGPNGLAFSPDQSQLYVVESRALPYRCIWRYDVGADFSLSAKTKLVEASDSGAIDGIKVDSDGNLWCGWGSNGALAAAPVQRGGRLVYPLQGRSEDLDGVMAFNPAGKPLAFLRLPERCANLCFGGPKGNRLYMASSHSLYAYHVGVSGT
jgi:gluconolactonase